MDMQQHEGKPIFSSSVPGEQAYHPDTLQAQQFRSAVQDEPNLFAALLAGGVVALVCAVIWAIVTAVTDYQIAWMAIGIGFLVGIAVRWAGKGTNLFFGMTGAVLSLLSCVAGNLLFVAIIVSQEEAMSLLEVLFIMVTSPMIVVEILQLTFSPIDLLFYGLALYVGYRTSVSR
ncbi:MAG: hypothetical protein JXB07_17550 [Anaerolineae bacterium]|nr:hypothetical protein [Anaerolineae bacterium]